MAGSLMHQMLRMLLIAKKHKMLMPSESGPGHDMPGSDFWMMMWWLYSKCTNSLHMLQRMCLGIENMSNSEVGLL